MEKKDKFDMLIKVFHRSFEKLLTIQMMSPTFIFDGRWHGIINFRHLYNSYIWFRNFGNYE